VVIKLAKVEFVSLPLSEEEQERAVARLAALIAQLAPVKGGVEARMEQVVTAPPHHHQGGTEQQRAYP